MNCTVEGCNKKHRARGYCNNHYALYLRNGSPKYKAHIQKCVANGCSEFSTPYTKYCKFHLHRNYVNIPFDIPRGRGGKKERNAWWKGGIAEYPNHSLMKRMRREILEESNYICYFCQSEAKEIHHLDHSKDNHSKDNLVACCHRCNHKNSKAYTSKYKRLYGHTLKELKEIFGNSLSLRDKDFIRNDPDAKIYPCSDCGKMRSEKEGGTVFTVCNECWDIHYSIGGKRSVVMTTKELLQRIEKIFAEKLSRKTGWGKNEILVAYKDSVKEALMEMIL